MKTKTVTVYESMDGRQFQRPLDAHYHDAELELGELLKGVTNTLNTDQKDLIVKIIMQNETTIFSILNKYRANIDRHPYLKTLE